MFIDYVALMLVNLAAGFLLLALHFIKYQASDEAVLAPGFLVVGFVATVTGLAMIFSWPLPGSYNIPFGELSVLFGTLFLGGGIALLKAWNLTGLGVYAIVAGLAAVVVGVRILALKMTNEPLLSGIGYILSGLSGFLTLPAYAFKKSRTVRIIAAVVLLASAAIWAFTGFGSYWTHLQSFGKWVPPTMQAPAK